MTQNRLEKIKSAITNEIVNYHILKLYPFASRFTLLSKVYALELIGFSNVSMIKDRHIFSLFCYACMIIYDDRIVKLKTKKQGNKLIASIDKMRMQCKWIVRG